MTEQNKITDLWIIADASYDNAPMLDYGFFLSEDEARNKIYTLPDGISATTIHIKAGEVTTEANPIVSTIPESDATFNLPKMEEMSEGTYYLSPYVYWNLFPRLAKFYKPGQEAKALEFIDSYGNHDIDDPETEFYNAWVVSELFYIFTGENLSALVKEQQSLGRPLNFYAIPENIYPARHHDLDYEEYVIPDSGIVALATLIEFAVENESTLQFATNQAARVMTGSQYDFLVSDSEVEWFNGVLD